MTKITGAYITGLFGAQDKWVGDATAQQLLASSLNTYIFWSLHVQPNGDLTYNNVSLVSNGVANTPVTDPIGKLIKDALASGKAQSIYFSIGAGGVSDWANIENILNNGGTNLSNFVQNLGVLVEMGVDGFDFDYEENIAQPVETIASMGELLYSHFKSKVTYCPYHGKSMWIDCLKQTFAKVGSQPVQAFNLQCYSGGGGNNPGQWINSLNSSLSGTGVTNAASFIRPGLAVAGSASYPHYNPDQMTDYLKSYPCTGAWIWQTQQVLESGQYSLNQYASAMEAGLS